MKLKQEIVWMVCLPLLLISSSLFISQAFAAPGDSPFERKFGDIKYLDAYFGTEDEKIEVSPGDENIPFTVVIANIGTEDITGIRGQLSLPFGFSSSDGGNSLIFADADSNALAGEVFTLTFFVNLDEQLQVGQYPGSAKIDYTRLRESGARNAFLNFDFKITGDSTINVKALEPFLTSLNNNQVIIQITNDGTAQISGVEIQTANTQTAISSTTQSVTNVENVVITETNWDVGNIQPGHTKYIETTIYVPESLKSETLRMPIEISYFNAHGDRHLINQIVDFYVKGLIDLTIYNVGVIELSGNPTIIGEIINEGNEDALFGFVTIKPLGDSNIKETTQFIDEIEIDSPVPFNVPVEFVGDPKYGEHDIQVVARYKDSVRDEIFVNYKTTVTIPDKPVEDENSLDMMMAPLLILPVMIAGIAFAVYKKKKQSKSEF
jgi:hypothetical protein